MKGLTISAHGGLDQLRVRDDLPMPEIQRPTDVRIRMRAAALNHLDLFVVHGMPGITLEPGSVLGADGTGVVEQIGDEVRDVRVGDTVVINPGISDGTCEYCRDGEQSLCLRFGILGEHLPGTIAEYAVVPATNVRAIPTSIPTQVAAAFSLATLTAWRMIKTRAQVRAGENVLIWGIGGGVAVAALQICKQVGARVWVTSSSETKLARASELGADEVINHKMTNVAKFIRERTAKRGVDVVVDDVGVATWQQSLQSLGRRGRLVTCGATTGPMVETDVRRLFWNQWSILGSTMGNHAEYDAIVEQLRAGRLAPPVDCVYSLADAPTAFQRLENAEQFGKVVIRIGE